MAHLSDHRKFRSFWPSCQAFFSLFRWVRRARRELKFLPCPPLSLRIAYTFRRPLMRSEELGNQSAGARSWATGGKGVSPGIRTLIATLKTAVKKRFTVLAGRLPTKTGGAKTEWPSPA